jgi:hypothetical protein
VVVLYIRAGYVRMCDGACRLSILCVQGRVYWYVYGFVIDGRVTV